MTTKQYLTYSITALNMLFGIQQTFAVHYIPSDTSIGTWDSVGRTYTLTSDVSDSIEIEEDNLALDGDGYSVTGSDPGGPPPHPGVIGVYLYGRTGITLKNLTVQKFTYGIRLSNSSNNTLTGNIVSQSAYLGTGIRLSNSSNNTLTGNIVSQSTYPEMGVGIGIGIEGSNNTLTGNIISHKKRGLELNYCTKNTLTGNEISDNFANFHIYGGSYEDFDHTIDTTNTVEGKPVYYVKNVNDQFFDSSTNAGVFYAINCDNITIKDLTLAKNNYVGIFLLNTHNSRIENVAVSECMSGIFLNSSSNNTIIDNIASQNTRGIMLWESSNSTLTNNTLSDNREVGIRLWASNSKIYNNNFINNDTQVFLEDCSGNLFNLDKPIGGNYWSDWAGPDDDEDGFVDSPYVFEGGQDDLPWTVQDGWITPEVRIEQLITEVESLNLQQGISNSLDSKLDAVEKALDDVNENNDGAAVNALGAFINAVNAQRGGKISEEDADSLIDAAQQIIDLLTNG